MTNYRRVLIGVVTVCILAGGLPVLAARLRAESLDRAVSMVADYQEFSAVAQEHGRSVDGFLRALHAAGVDALAVHEDTLAELDDLGLLTVQTGSQLLDAARLGRRPPVPVGRIAAQGVYAFGFASPALQAWVGRALVARFGQRRVRRTGNAYEVAGNAGRVEAQGLGYRPGELRALRRLGFQIVLRPQDSPGLTGAGVQRYFRRIEAEVPLHLIIFDGLLSMGYPHALGAVSRAMKADHLVLGAIETPVQLGLVDQKGIRRIARAIGERVSRVYSIPPWIIGKQPPQTVVDNVVSAIDTRHDRVIYMHPFTSATVDPAHVISANVQNYHAMAEVIRRRGYAIGPVRPMPLVSVSRWERMLLELGAVAGGLLLLSMVFPAMGWTWLLVCGLLALAAGAVSATLSRELAALGAAVSFGGLAALVVARMWRHPPRHVWAAAVLNTLASAGVAFVGALFVATLLGGTQHLLEWSYFRGVKVSYLGPPLLALVGYVVYTSEPEPGRDSFWDAASRLLDRPLTLRIVIAGMVVLGAGAIYLLRSGNVSSVLSIEQHMRFLLERTLIYRPREKEFLVGYPSLFLATLAAYRRRPGWFLIFLLGASTGFVSLVDSFEHLRTPFATSFFRESFGLLGGLLTGSAGLGVVSAAIGWWERRQRTS